MRWLLTLLLFPRLLSAGSIEYRFEIPEVAYLQWLSSPYDEISIGPTESTAAFPVYMQTLTNEMNIQEIYLGVLCNSMNGYRVQIQASDAIDSMTAQALANNGTSVNYEMELEAYGSAMSNGSHPSVMLDITGMSDSIFTTFSNPQGLPLNSHSAHVFRLEARLKTEYGPLKPPKLIDFYTGMITATVYLP